MSTSDRLDIDPQQGISALWPEYGITREGRFIRPGSDVLWEVAVGEAQQRFGSLLSSPVESELQYVEMLVLFMYAGFEQMQANYQASTYRRARGPQLDAHLALAGFDRLPRQEATGEVTFIATGARQEPPESGNWVGGNDRDRSVPSGTLVATEADESNPQIVFETTEPAMIPAGQPTVERVPVRALGPFDPRQELTREELGETTNVPAGAIKELVESVRGVKSGGVTNPLPTGDSGARNDGTGDPYDFVAGRDKELDRNYRQRWDGSRGLNGVATLEGVESSIRNAGDGTIVRDVRVRENFTDQDNRSSGGSTPHSVAPDVWLREDTQPIRDAIHQAILDSTAGGYESYGSIDGSALLFKGTENEREYPPPDQDIVDNSGETRSGLGFSPIEKVSVHISAELVTTSQFPADGIEQITDEIVAYIGGELTNGRDIPGELAIGDDVIGDKLQGIVQNPDVRGVYDVTGEPGVHIGTAADPSDKQDVPITSGQVARTDPEKIVLTTTPATPQ